MKGLKLRAQELFDNQTAGKASLAEVRELSFAQCCIADDLLATSFPQLSNLSRITLVNMKPPLKDKSFEAILAALPESAKQNTLRAIDVCDNGVSSFPLSSSSTSSFPKLVRLIMANNSIESLEGIFGANGNVAANDAPKSFPSLRTLDVEDNGVSKELAKTAFELCPSLVVVNGKNKDGEDWHDASDDDFDDDDMLDGGDDEGEGNGDVDAFVGDSDDDEDDAEEFSGKNNSNENAKESPARRNREE